MPERAQRASSEWFWEHYDDAADQIISFLAGDGLSLTGKDVADVGCGDGIIDLALAQKAAPASFVGFDVRPSTGDMLAKARAEGVAEELPPQLRFETSQQTRLPAGDDSFDFVVTWSTFEHVQEPAALLRDVHRVLRPGGILMLQLWPFYHSEHGSHLWQWFSDGFVQLRSSPPEIERAVRGNPGPDPPWAEEMLEEFRTLNRITLDGLQSALHSARFAVRKLELLTHAIHIPPELERYPLSLLGVAGVKLLASPH